MSDLNPEDSKIVTLARSARARLRAPESAAVRDVTGRTYVAGPVALPSLTVSAIQAAIVVAVASGAERIAAVAIVTEASAVADGDVAAVRYAGSDQTPIFIAGPDGTVRDRISVG